ncbi:STXB protein, partial [Atractosteus spatula]|nr:STXB protein [Atractosteus spatula]
MSPILLLLLSDFIPLTLDDRTAQKYLWISEESRRVSRRTEETCPYRELPERFEHCPQVLCREGLSGLRCYWEVEWSGWVVLGVTYEAIGRKGENGACGLGENRHSWGLGWAGSEYQAWHDAEHCDISGTPGSHVLGVYLDQPAGVLSFYCLKGGDGEEEGGEAETRAVLLHKFKTPFTDPLYPVFWVGRNSHCLIRRI